MQRHSETINIPLTVVTPLDVVAAVVYIHVAAGTQVEHFPDFSAVDSQNLEHCKGPIFLNQTC